MAAEEPEVTSVDATPDEERATDTTTTAMAPATEEEATVAVSVAGAFVSTLTWGEVVRLHKIGKTLLESGMFPSVQNAKQALVKILYGREFGLGPIASLSAFDFFEGRLTPTSKFKAALSRKVGIRYEVEAHSDEECRLVWYEGDRLLGRSWFTQEDARRAGKLQPTKSGKPGVYQTWPANMLFWRAVSRGVDWFAPHALQGDGFLEQPTAPVE